MVTPDDGVVPWIATVGRRDVVRIGGRPRETELREARRWHPNRFRGWCLRARSNAMTLLVLLAATARTRLVASNFGPRGKHGVPA